MTGEPKQPPQYLTACNLLIAVNVAVMFVFGVIHPYDLMFASPTSLIDFGGNFGILTADGQYWRLLSCLFVQNGLVHLALNMYSLWCVGPTAEELFGWRMFVIIYFFSGIIASLTSFFHDPLNTSVGASGAILGVFGSLLSFLYVQRDKYPRATLVYYASLAIGLFGACIVIGYLVPGIDNYAHLGGFVAGMFAGLCLAHLEVSERRRVAYTVPVMILMIGLWGWAAERNFQNGDFLDYPMAMRDWREGKFASAASHFSKFLEKHPRQVEALVTRGLAYARMGELHLAVNDFTKVISIEPRLFAAYNSRAWVEIGLGEYQQALTDATIALELNPRSAATFDTRGYAYWKLGKTEQALADFSRGLKFDPHNSACHYHRMKLYESLGQTANADADKQGAVGYEPDPWES